MKATFKKIGPPTNFFFLFFFIYTFIFSFFVINLRGKILKIIGNLSQSGKLMVLVGTQF